MLALLKAVAQQAMGSSLNPRQAQKRGTGAYRRSPTLSRRLRELAADNGWDEPIELPATVLDVDDATAKQLNVTLNNVEGEFDPYKLGELFADIFPAIDRR